MAQLLGCPLAVVEEDSPGVGSSLCHSFDECLLVPWCDREVPGRWVHLAEDTLKYFQSIKYWLLKYEHLSSFPATT